VLHPHAVADAFDLADPATRRWLNLLEHPDRLGQDAVLRQVLGALGRLPAQPTPLLVGRAGVQLLVEVAVALGAERPAGPRDAFAQQVLRTWVLDRLKLDTAARRLGISTRQLTRERARVLSRVTSALLEMVADSRAAGPAEHIAVDVADRPAYPLEPIPEISGFVPRPELAAALTEAIGVTRAVHVHGGAGMGKTSLVAQVVAHLKPARPVIWYRFRPGVNDSLPAIVFELAHHLRHHGRPRTADALESPATPDATLLSRLVLQDLSGHPLVAVFDDAQLAEDHSAIRAFLEDLATRLEAITIVTVSRHEEPRPSPAVKLEVMPLDRRGAGQLLNALGSTADKSTVDKVFAWTGGSPHLIRLADSWLRIATEEEVAEGLAGFTRLDDVQAYLLDTLTAVIDSRDRDILDAASTFRTLFTDGLLSAVSGHPLAAVRDTSRHLVRSRIATRSRIGVAFVHESIRDYVYARLTDERRAEFHRRAAKWYADNGDAAESAFHALSAELDTSRATGGRAAALLAI
jgi:hypothetical protein